MFMLLAGILGSVLSLGTTGTSPNAANYGEVRFDNSCAPSVQQPLQQAIALLHSFEFGEATATECAKGALLGVFRCLSLETLLPDALN